MAGATICKHCKSDLKAPLPWKDGARKKGSKMSYDEVVDKVGLVPNVKARDNLIQGVVVGVFALIGGFIGLIGGGWPEGFGLGVVGGLIVGGFLSGLVLMFIGLTRKD
jgi:hypothetical protein